MTNGQVRPDGTNGEVLFVRGVGEEAPRVTNILPKETYDKLLIPATDADPTPHSSSGVWPTSLCRTWHLHRISFRIHCSLQLWESSSSGPFGHLSPPAFCTVGWCLVAWTPIASGFRSPHSASVPTVSSMGDALTPAAPALSSRDRITRTMSVTVPGITATTLPTKRFTKGGVLRKRRMSSLARLDHSCVRNE
jgi:hypothetical protein